MGHTVHLEKLLGFFWSLQKSVRQSEQLCGHPQVRERTEHACQFRGATVRPPEGCLSSPLRPPPCGTPRLRSSVLASLAGELLLNPPHLSRPSSNVPSWQPPLRPQAVPGQPPSLHSLLSCAGGAQACAPQARSPWGWVKSAGATSVLGAQCHRTQAWPAASGNV